ncbi:MAG: glycine cleavage system protein GcvH [Bacteroidia bacterium]
MNIPADLAYSTEHEWVRLEGDAAYIGITDFAQQQLGDIIYVDVPTLGKTLKAGEVFGSIEAVKTVADLFLPIDAEILEINPELSAHPEYINQDPYGKGWIVRVRPLMRDLSHLLSAETYQQMLPT